VDPLAEAPDAAAADAALKMMAPIISHEIRNPLAAIGNSSYYIKSRLGQQESIDPKIQKHLAIIAAELRHADETLSEILAYARMREPAPRPAALHDLILAALNQLPDPAAAPVRKSLRAKDPRVVADSGLVESAIYHLLRNAVQAAAAKSPRSAVDISTRIEPPWAVIEVSDEGPGLPPEAHARLFQPFNTTKPRGMGLGLAFVKKVIALHRGFIELVSSAPSGTTFRVRLPLAD
jgi:signal transduction histidine kinase